ncbi:hypothetical protein GCM10028822_07440 [Hymenobacter terrigena]
MNRFWSACLALPGLFVAAMPAAAQSEPVAAVAPRPKTIEYFSAEHRLLPTSEGANYRLETTYRDSVAGTVRKYDAAGKLKWIIPYGHLRLKIRHGVSTTWYENGQMHTKEDYVAGRQSGEMLVYYSDGTLRRRDQFVQGKRTAGECFDPDGQPTAYFEYRIKPVYSEGDGSNAAVVHAIQRQVQYPIEALRLALNARVIIGFTVDRQGRVQEVHVEKEPPVDQIAPQLREAFVLVKKSALDAARKLKSFQPGQIDGEVAPVGYTVPITFRME